MKIKFWLIGIAVAGVGLLLARVISPRLAQPAFQVASYLGGVVVVLAGLVIITFGMRGHSGE